MSEIDPRYVAARRVLLNALIALRPHADALIALRPHADALIIAGAQAVYLHTGDGDLAVAPFTTDGDLAVDPTLLRPDPLLEVAMRGAGFELARYDGHVEPGIWMASADVDGEELLIPVDLIVPEAAAIGGGRRSARLGAHGRHAARRPVGLEAALIDHTPMTIAALDTEDPRSIVANVAGAAALMVAKAHKIHDRVQRRRPERIDDKDAADVLRLMQTTAAGCRRRHAENLGVRPGGRRRLVGGDHVPRGAVRAPRTTRCRDGYARTAPRHPRSPCGSDLRRLHDGAAPRDTLRTRPLAGGAPAPRAAPIHVFRCKRNRCSS